MFKGRWHKGSSMVEYAVPLALIGVVVGFGIYSITTDNSFLKNIMFSSSGQVDSEGGKISFGTGTAVGGVYMSTDGKMYLNNSSGQTIRIPLPFYDKYKDSLSQYLKDGKFDFTSSQMGEETTGAVGIEDIAKARSASTLLYSTLIELAANGMDDEESKKLLLQMATYGEELGGIETELIGIKEVIDKNFENFTIQTKIYWQAKNAYDDALEAYQKDPTEENMANVDSAYLKMKSTYSIYATAVDKYKTVSDDYLTKTKTYFDKLKDETGVSFDEVLEKINNSTEISADIKEYVVPVGQKISAIKDSVDVIEKMVNAFYSDFDDVTNSYNSFNETFKSFDIVIDDSAGDETFDLLDEEYLKDKDKKDKGK
ncbi:MAG: hypothetical protein AB7V50_02915 [Vampirovibrionia bacterium]